MSKISPILILPITIQIPPYLIPNHKYLPKNLSPPHNTPPSASTRLSRHNLISRSQKGLCPLVFGSPAAVVFSPRQSKISFHRSRLIENVAFCRVTKVTPPEGPAGRIKQNTTSHSKDNNRKVLGEVGGIYYNCLSGEYGSSYSPERHYTPPKKTPRPATLSVAGRDYDGGYLLSHTIVQYHRRWRA